MYKNVLTNLFLSFPSTNNMTFNTSFIQSSLMYKSITTAVNLRHSPPPVFMIPHVNTSQWWVLLSNLYHHALKGSTHACFLSLNNRVLINWRQAAYRNDLVLLSCRSFLMSLAFLINNSNTSRSRQRLSKRAELVMQFFCLQHLFSISCGIRCRTAWWGTMIRWPKICYPKCTATGCHLVKIGASCIIRISRSSSIIRTEWI